MSPPALTLCLSRESMWLTICIRSSGWMLLTLSWGEQGDSTGGVTICLGGHHSHGPSSIRAPSGQAP